MEGKLLKAVDLARCLGVSRSVVYLWLKQGLPYLEAPGIGRRFEVDQVKDWLRQFERSAVTSRIDCKPVFDPGGVEVQDGFPKGVYGKPGKALMIWFMVPDGDKSRRVRESAKTRDPIKAVALRRDRIREAWKDEPESIRRELFMKEAGDQS